MSRCHVFDFRYLADDEGVRCQPCYILTFNVFVFACSVREEEKMERIWDSVVKFIDINVRNNSQGVMIKI